MSNAATTTSGTSSAESAADSKPAASNSEIMLGVDVADKADPQPHITADSIEVLGALIREAHGK